ncbi:hypothetical protein C9374_002482 [Naegleria lovaniensis]|uniref:Uncharacterized protein n=1 Tax=Naegleria lovaniensis TaxID=51637 RepID=A0AA88KLK7_NAELO|nr:uncharacterized protein C9374_002482 [Naegleria lovaniensis]KAG2386738.1 hypothetical protein C9374_002482 [Naegleria lovaniensis]
MTLHPQPFNNSQQPPMMHPQQQQPPLYQSHPQQQQQQQQPHYQPPPQIPYDQYMQRSQQQQVPQQPQQQYMMMNPHPYHQQQYQNYGNPQFIPQQQQHYPYPHQQQPQPQQQQHWNIPPQPQQQPMQPYSYSSPSMTMNYPSSSPTQPQSISPYPQKGNEVNMSTMMVQQQTTTQLPQQQPPQTVYIPPPQQPQVQQPPVCSTTTTTMTTSFVPLVDQSLINLQTLQQLATSWLSQRQAILLMLSEMTEKLNKHAKSTTKTKMGGTVTNIVGASLIVGGIITAPLTLGGSLLATGAGAAMVGGGTAVTVGAAVSEWQHAKKSAQLIQTALEQDAKAVNEIIALVFDYRITDPLIEQRLLTFTIPHSNATTTVPVLQFVNALVNLKYGTINQNGQLTHGQAGATSLASLVVKGVVPIVSVPIDLCLLVSESKKLHGKEPSKLASQVTPIIDSMKYQTKMATGITSL